MRKYDYKTFFREKKYKALSSKTMFRPNQSKQTICVSFNFFITLLVISTNELKDGIFLK